MNVAREESHPSPVPETDEDFVLSVLPHRPPFLLVDRVVALERGRWIRTTRSLPAGDPLLNEQGTLASPLLIESIAQSTAALLLSTHTEATPILLGIDRATFSGTARAGDVIHLYAEIAWLRQRIGRARGTATDASGMVLCETEFTFGWRVAEENRSSATSV